jgi:hypothetical protein
MSSDYRCIHVTDKERMQIALTRVVPREYTTSRPFWDGGFFAFQRK